MPDEDDDYEEDDEPQVIEREIFSPALALTGNPQLDDALVMRLTYDLAAGLHSPHEIAVRYGFFDSDGLRHWLRGHPEVVEEGRKLTAIFRSDTSSEERVRMKFLHATERLVVPMAHLAMDPKAPLGARIDCFRQIQRGAGMDGMSSAQKQLADKTTGGQMFSLTINFAGGRVTGAALPVVIDGTVDGDDGPAADNADNADNAGDMPEVQYDEEDV